MPILLQWMMLRKDRKELKPELKKPMERVMIMIMMAV